MKTDQTPPPALAVRIKEEQSYSSSSGAPMEKQPSALSTPIKIEQCASPSAAALPASHASSSAAVAAPSIQASSAIIPAIEAGPAAMAAGDADPPLLKSVSNLRGLSSALFTFTLRFDELRLHLNSIKDSIDKRSKELDTEETSQAERNPPSKSLAEPPLPVLADHPPPKLDVICQSMHGRTLRKYVATRLPQIQMLREEVPDALKRAAPEPARLVLDSLCRFYIQGSKAFADHKSRAVILRRASIRILEFFLLAGCPKVEPPVKAEAEKAADAWRNRLVREGGISTAYSEDAMGLLLLVAAFGLASVFRTDDLCVLVQMSKVWKRAMVICRSPQILEMIQDIIPWMEKNGMHTAAVGLVCKLELKDKFSPQAMLSSFLRVTDKTAKKMRKEGQGSPEALKEVCKKKLAALKSVVKCVEDFRLNADELAHWKINEKIATLEKHISDLVVKAQERAAQKRKAKELGSSENAKHLAAKRHQPNTVNTPFPGQPTPAVVPSPPQPKILFDPKFPGLVNAYSGALVKPAGALSDRSSMGLLTTNVHSPSMRIGGVLPAGVGPLTGSDLGPSTSSGVGPYAGIGGGLPIGNSSRPFVDNGIRSYEWHREGAFNSHSVGQSLLGGFLPSAVPQSLPEPSASMLPSHRDPGNLYQFADIVLEGESYYGSSRMGNVAPAAAAAQAPVYHHHPYY
ncbi:protein FRIGIDA-like isoform X2 [Magnolia sinica]|uniref:protein FRIGIDA-like isoform X2 n=1 Tax=Magnolia sinica TaxID=86752 RepID=UPI002658F23A|nr:protein FRIGIDA-like isoform X2 [Magnolia sinica]